jgi:hypothetical protein
MRFDHVLGPGHDLQGPAAKTNVSPFHDAVRLTWYPKPAGSMGAKALKVTSGGSASPDSLTTELLSSVIQIKPKNGRWNSMSQVISCLEDGSVVVFDPSTGGARLFIDARVVDGANMTAFVYTKNSLIFAGEVRLVDTIEPMHTRLMDVRRMGRYVG